MKSRDYADISLEAMQAVSQLGFGILTKPKYADRIVGTDFIVLPNGIFSVEYYDDNNKIVAEAGHKLPSERGNYPLIGEVSEIPWQKTPFSELIKIRAPRVTQQMCADRCGVSVSTWKRWEAGETEPREMEQYGIIDAISQLEGKGPINTVAPIVPHICKKCGRDFSGGVRALYCPECRVERHREICREAAQRKKTVR